MILFKARLHFQLVTFPRTRWDDPQLDRPTFEKYSFSRTRGDDPEIEMSQDYSANFSPHTRG